MDRSISVRTPESVAFSYELAGLGSRFLALAIDLLLQTIVAAIIFFSAAYLESRLHPAVSAKWLNSFGIAIVIVTTFAIFFGYFIIFEALRDGRTPGKQIMRVRVVRDGGYAVDFGSALIRNLIRILEMALGFYAISAVAALASPENKRLGDMAAGTIVVREGRAQSLVQIQEASDASAPLLEPHMQAIVDRFVARRDSLARDARMTLAMRIADRVRPQLAPELRRLDDETLLERLSAR